MSSLSKINPDDGVIIWETDEVLDYLSNKHYRDKALEQLKDKRKGVLVTHIAKTYELGDIPMFVLLIRDSDFSLKAIVGKERDFISFTSGLVVHNVISEHQFDILMEQMKRL